MIVGLTPDSINGFLKVLSNKQYGEPTPNFSDLDLDKLISALKTPFLRPQDENNNDSDLKIFAHLFCIMVESHYAPNGNKRLAVISLLSVLKLNNYALETTDVRLYAIAMAVTWLSKYDLFEESTEEVFSFLKNECVKKPNRISDRERSRLEKEFVDFMEGVVAKR